jgi:hypothetical protein
MAMLIRAEAADNSFGGTPLPEQVAYLNKCEDFFIGNGLVGGGGTGNGTWNFLVGPDYTCPNYLRSEEVRLVVDGVEQSLTMDVHRARKTGVFYGTRTIGDLKVYLIDYVVVGKPCVARLIRIENESHDRPHTVSVQAYIVPITGPGHSDWISLDGNGLQAGIGLKLDTSLKCVVGHLCTNWTNRYALIAFNEKANAISLTQGGYLLQTVSRLIPPETSSEIGLDHYLHYEGQSDRHYIELVQQRNILKDLAGSIAWWQGWFDGVAPQYSLSQIKDKRARDLVEGGLAILKMNECRDGGIVANERGWDMSYVRDAYCGLRGLTAFGHFEESKRFIEWLDHQYNVHGLIPNAAPGGSDTYVHPNGNNGVWCSEANAIAEVTALYILAARDYYKGTHDLQTLRNVNISLRYAMEAQLKYADTNDDRMEFSGDETELCGAVDIKSTGFDRKLAKYWSMSSVALCSASLDFYIQYLIARGDNPASYLNLREKRTLNLYDEQSKFKDVLEKDFWRTNLPECPAGFHDWFRTKNNNSWPSGRIVNFTLFPIFYGTPMKYPERAKCDVSAMKQFFDPATRCLPLVGKAGERSLGHDLGYLLWGLVACDDPEKNAVYDALVNGPTVRCWGTYNEAYDADGSPNANSLRTFETGVNLSAIGKYWAVGSSNSGMSQCHANQVTNLSAK